MNGQDVPEEAVPEPDNSQPRSSFSLVEEQLRESITHDVLVGFVGPQPDLVSAGQSSVSNGDETAPGDHLGYHNAPAAGLGIAPTPDAGLGAETEYGPLLITNAGRHSMGNALRTELARTATRRFVWSVAFISAEEVRSLKQDFLDFVDRGGRGTIITSTFQWFNTPEAFEELFRLGEVTHGAISTFVWHGQAAGRLGKDARFHAKGYMFAARGGRTVYIGSSNLTNSALSTNREWNLRVTSTDDGAIVSQIDAETATQKAESIRLSRQWIDDYTPMWQKNHRAFASGTAPVEDLWPLGTADATGSSALSTQAPSDAGDAASRLSSQPSHLRIEPNAMQQVALRALARTREEGYRRGIIVSATGTGKTYLSALDARSVSESMAGQNTTGRHASFRLLYIVGQRQILLTAMRSYQRVFDCPFSQMALLSGSDEGLPAGARFFRGGQIEEVLADSSVRFIFTTTDTIGRIAGQIPADAFTYVVADEAHHSTAKTYRAIVDHLRPRFMLGMTATPERTGEGSDEVFSLFDHNVVYEIRLRGALDAGLLCPFHYYGVAEYVGRDVRVDARQMTTEQQAQIAWELSHPSADRARYIINKLAIYAPAGVPVRGLVFCSRNDEAQRLSDLFNTMEDPVSGRLWRTRAVTSSNGVDRNQAVADLEAGRLDYIFTVDLFNEGVDIPSLNQIVMLRQTKSSIIFTQQLGRGLRRAPRKSSVVVIDFIGNYATNYLIPLALYGTTADNDVLRRQLARRTIGFSSISFDTISRERVLRTVESARLGSMTALTQTYRLIRGERGRVPTLLEIAASDVPAAIQMATAETKHHDYPAFVLSRETKTLRRAQEAMGENSAAGTGQGSNQGSSQGTASRGTAEAALTQADRFVVDLDRQFSHMEEHDPHARGVLRLVTSLVRGLRPHELLALARLYHVPLDPIADVDDSRARALGLYSDDLRRDGSHSDEWGSADYRPPFSVLTASDLDRCVQIFLRDLGDDDPVRRFAADASRHALHVLGVTGYFTSTNQKLYGGVPLVLPSGQGVRANRAVFSWFLHYPLLRAAAEDAIRLGLLSCLHRFTQATGQGRRIERGFVYGEKYGLYDIMRLCCWEKEIPPLNVGGYKLDDNNTMPILIKYADSQYEDRFLDQRSLRYFSKDRRTLSSREILWLRRHFDPSIPDQTAADARAAGPARSARQAESAQPTRSRQQAQSTQPTRQDTDQRNQAFVPVFIMRRPAQGENTSGPADTDYYYVGHVWRVTEAEQTSHPAQPSQKDKELGLTPGDVNVVRMRLDLADALDPDLFRHLTGRPLAF